MERIYRITLPRVYTVLYRWLSLSAAYFSFSFTYSYCLPSYFNHSPRFGHTPPNFLLHIMLSLPCSVCRSYTRTPPWPRRTLVLPGPVSRRRIALLVCSLSLVVGLRSLTAAVGILMHSLMHVHVVMRCHRWYVEMLPVRLARRSTGRLRSGDVVRWRSSRLERLFVILIDFVNCDMVLAIH